MAPSVSDRPQHTIGRVVGYHGCHSGILTAQSSTWCIFFGSTKASRSTIRCLEYSKRAIGPFRVRVFANRRTFRFRYEIPFASLVIFKSLVTRCFGSRGLSKLEQSWPTGRQFRRGLRATRQRGGRNIVLFSGGAQRRLSLRATCGFEWWLGVWRRGRRDGPGRQSLTSGSKI